MSAKHTPGPWFYVAEDWDGEPVEDPNFFKIHGPRHFADVYVLTIHEDHSIAEANARLIAAAPELLAALREISERKSASLIGSPWQEIERLQEIAEAAIAKATGGEP